MGASGGLLAAAILLGTPGQANAQIVAQTQTVDPAACRTGDFSACDRYVYDFNETSGVPENLKASEYLFIVTALRGKAFKQLNNHIKNGNWGRAATDMLQQPFSALRAASLYLSAALMREGEYVSAVQNRIAFRDLDVKMEDVKQVAEAVDLEGALPEQVVQSFEQLVESLNQFLVTVPPKYQAEFSSDVATNLVPQTGSVETADAGAS
ncbi:hypothetical protein FOA52_014548 [Chlamydomonas sp. UWO 241]|nr:hypothetical protein FOA52_014548 [Chlamydomonas sp. UWO 241]